MYLEKKSNVHSQVHSEIILLSLTHWLLTVWLDSLPESLHLLSCARSGVVLL